MLSLVVRTEKRSPVSNNQILTDVVLEFREIRRTEDYALLLIENYVIAVVIRHDAGIHTLAASCQEPCPPWAMKPTVGTVLSVFEGSEAIR